jgi:predicted AAA+ superfamily ATPase
MIDADRKPGRLILTGSQVFPLMEGVSESLAGRCGILTVMNLAASELRSFQDSGIFSETDFLFKGGYPELHARPEIAPQFWYGAYLATYLERDVRNILNVGSLRDFDRFLRAVAARTGQILSYSDLARDVGIAPNTAKKWISVLQASGQVFLLEPYFRNIGKRLVKSPKLYLCDTGLAVFLMGFESWQAVERHPAVGALWETHVVMEVIKSFAARGKGIPLWFWRTAWGAEVDLLIERDGRFTAIECKYAEVIDEPGLKGLRAFAETYGRESLQALYVASRTSRTYPLSGGITAVPGSEIADYLE